MIAPSPPMLNGYKTYLRPLHFCRFFLITFPLSLQKGREFLRDYPSLSL